MIRKTKYLVGAVLLCAMLSGLVLMSFSAKNEEVVASTVTYGVVEEDNGRLYLTEEEVDINDGDCGTANFPCKVIFDPTEVMIEEDETGRPYINEVLSSPPYTAIGQGPFTP